ncbi:GntR family transcriptional regulator [Actinocorallia longicatena]|uniref:HTH gntR-type domain-containing protein n=1 Tax=Actinocorallia longicatena TaxID=111803 RepID=A0ABP6QNT1_9ACTN
MPRIGFHEIAAEVRRKIDTGELAPGSAVPSESVLADEYRVSRTTVRRALVQLEDDGLIEAKQGRGRFVSSEVDLGRARTDKKYERVADSIRRELATGKPPAGERLEPVDDLAERFGVSTGTVRKALAVLEAEKLIAAVQSKGWFAGDLAGESNKTLAVAERLRQAISSGEIEVGSVLPGEPTLAAEYGVARITVSRAFAALEAEGLIENLPGRGRRVLPRP